MDELPEKRDSPNSMINQLDSMLFLLYFIKGCGVYITYTHHILLVCLHACRRLEIMEPVPIGL
jgi:hypothetical protein